MSKQMRNRIRMVLRWVFYVGNEYFTTARRRIETRRDAKKKFATLRIVYYSIICTLCFTLKIYVVLSRHFDKTLIFKRSHCSDFSPKSAKLVWKEKEYTILLPYLNCFEKLV